MGTIMHVELIMVEDVIIIIIFFLYKKFAVSISFLILYMVTELLTLLFNICL
jgi:hypothetical protein